MGKLLLFLVFGAIFVFGTFSRSMNEKIDDSVENAVVHFERATARNIANSAIGLGLRQLSDNGDWRDGFTDRDVDGGTVTLTVRDSVVGGDSTIVLLSTSTFGNETTSSRVIVKTAQLFGSVNAAVMTSLEGFDKAGGSGLVSGDDSSSTSDCAGGEHEALPGLIAPDNSVTQGGNVINGSEGWLEGDPPYVAGGTQADVANQIDINWEEVLALTPDYVVNSGSQWPGSSAFSGGQWPVIFVGTGVKLSGNPMSGQGLIVAPDDLEMSGAWKWDGLVLIGESFRLSGNVQINGGLISGLNFTLGETTTASNIGEGNIGVTYDECNVLEAFEATTGKVQGSWTRRFQLVSWWE